MKKIFVLANILGVALVNTQQLSWAGDVEEVRKIKVSVTHINHREVITDTEYIVQAPTQAVAKIVREGLDQWSEYVPDYPYSRVVGDENVRRILDARPRTFKEALHLLSTEMKPVEDRVSRTSQNEVGLYVLQQVKLPWPVSRRWSLAKVVYQPGEASGTDPSHRAFTEKYEMVVGDCVKAGGRWEVKPDKNHPGWSVVFNEHILDFGIQVPSFIIKSFSRKIAREVHQALRERAEMLAKSELAEGH